LGKFYVIGGDNSEGEILTTCESIAIQGVESGMKWTASQSMKYPRKNFAVAVVDNESKIMVIGGGMDESNRSIEIYDPKVNLWSARGKL
jgi:N-acetylneuraminic acid mutarotase